MCVLHIQYPISHPIVEDTRTLWRRELFSHVPSQTNLIRLRECIIITNQPDSLTGMYNHHKPTWFAYGNVSSSQTNLIRLRECIIITNQPDLRTAMYNLAYNILRRGSYGGLDSVFNKKIRAYLWFDKWNIILIQYILAFMLNSVFDNSYYSLIVKK